MSQGGRPLSGLSCGGGVQRVVLCLLAAGLTAILSCDDSTEPTEPRSPSTIGVLQGHVRVAGEAVAIGVGARLFEYPGTIVAQTRSDAGGRYRLSLQPGTYRIELNPRIGLGYQSSDVSDTVHVESGVRFLEIRRGSLTARVRIPGAPNGAWFTCGLEPSPPLDLPYVNAIAQDERVEFKFPIVTLGAHRLQLRTIDGFRGWWLPGTNDPSAADAVIVQATRATLYETTVRNYATISGTIRGSWQEVGASRPDIRAYTLAGQELARTACAGDGTFTLGLFDVQPVRLVVSITWIGQWIGGDAFDTATTFDLHAGQHLTGISVVEGGILCQLEGPGLLTSHRAQVEVHEKSGRTYSVDSFGGNPISICNLRPGSYKLYVHGDCDYDGEPWASQWYAGADSMADATSIQVAEGHATRVVMHLDHDGRIEGRVLDSAGQPVPAHVVVYRGDAPLCPDQYSDYARSSSFSIRGLGNGDYTLAAVVQDPFALGLDPNLWWYPGTSSPDSAEVLRIRNHATLTGIEWRLPGRFGERAP